MYVWRFLVLHLLMSLSKALGLISKQCIFKDRTKKPNWSEQGKNWEGTRDRLARKAKEGGALDAKLKM